MHYLSQFMREDFVGKILALFLCRMGIAENDLTLTLTLTNQQLGQLVYWGEAKQNTSANSVSRQGEFLIILRNACELGLHSVNLKYLIIDRLIALLSLYQLCNR
jgi:hypothetical protein